MNTNRPSVDRWGSHESMSLPQSIRGADSRASHRILVVEDDVMQASAISRLITKAGWVPVVAHDVRSARTAMAAQFDALAVDLSLPDGSGFDVIEAAREQAPRIPVLVVTSSHAPVDINRANALHAEYLCKPPPSDAVADFLARVVSENLARLDLEVRALADRYGLTAAHVRLVMAAARESASYAVLTERLGVKRSTIKTLIRQVLERTGGENLEELVAPLRARAFS